MVGEKCLVEANPCGIILLPTLQKLVILEGRI